MRRLEGGGGGVRLREHVIVADKSVADCVEAVIGLYLVTGGLEEAARRMNESRSVKSEEANLIFRCINELGLIQLDRDDMISPQQMISCCSSLLKAASRIRFLRFSCLSYLSFASSDT